MTTTKTKSETIANRIGFTFIFVFAGFAIWYIATALSMVIPYIATHSHN